jgi:hypothetical protein
MPLVSARWAKAHLADNLKSREIPMKLKKTVSDAVRQKNQRNSKKSTGPNTPPGKNHSRFNAVKHGLTSRLLMYDQDGEPIDRGVAEMIEALRDRYGADNIVAELLIDSIAADFWRQNKGLEAEVSYFSQGTWAFHPQGCLPTIQRYNTTNRRALLKNLELLEKLCPASSQVATVGDEDEESPSAEVEKETCSPGKEPSSSDQVSPQQVETAVLDFDRPDVAHSEEWTDATEPPMLNGNPEDGETTA